jgi:TPR repeat protein
VEAVKWFRKAAEQNDARAQYNLSFCYATGTGVAKDHCEAYKWRLLAARQGQEDAKKQLTLLESKLTPEQIAEGQKRARDFKPR